MADERENQGEIDGIDDPPLNRTLSPPTRLDRRAVGVEAALVRAGQAWFTVRSAGVCPDRISLHSNPVSHARGAVQECLLIDCGSGRAYLQAGA